jgi:hypothetical protein
MPVNTTSGCTIAIGHSTIVNPVPSADTYTVIGFPTNLGAFGRTYVEINFDDLSNRNTLKFKGQRNDGTMAIQVGRAAEDAGQAAAIVARDSDQDFNFRVTLNDSSGTTSATPTTFYFLAKVMSYTTNIGGPNKVVDATVNVAIKSGSITETAAT